jgi:hypothetical protein
VLYMLNAMACTCMYRGSVIPAYAGIQFQGVRLDSCVRRNDHDAAYAVC